MDSWRSSMHDLAVPNSPSRDTLLLCIFKTSSLNEADVSLSICKSRVTSSAFVLAPLSSTCKPATVLSRVASLVLRSLFSPCKPDTTLPKVSSFAFNSEFSWSSFSERSDALLKASSNLEFSSLRVFLSACKLATLSSRVTMLP
ncbi:hypothetical protein Mapa_002054 [Marchantia paleacea]|nr:hypothetical protein Mapa_002054 [Marchantia paleacea]